MAETKFKVLSPTSKCDSMIWEADAAVEAGNVVIVGNVAGIAVEDASTGDEIALVTRAPKCIVPLDAGVQTGDFTQGAPVYIDPATGQADPAASGNMLVGFVYEAASPGDTGVKTDFDGHLGLVD